MATATPRHATPFRRSTGFNHGIDGHVTAYGVPWPGRKQTLPLLGYTSGTHRVLFEYPEV
jgi:hypothetical protein